MSEELNLATASTAEMKAYAANELDLKLALTMSPETMRQRILDRCAELQIDPPKAEIKADHRHAGQDRYWVMVGKQPGAGGAEPAFVGVQCVGYLIPRNIKVSVPASVVEALKNAVQEIVTQDDDGNLHSEEVLTYPYQVLGKVA